MLEESLHSLHALWLAAVPENESVLLQILLHLLHQPFYRREPTSERARGKFQLQLRDREAGRVRLSRG